MITVNVHNNDFFFQKAFKIKEQLLKIKGRTFEKIHVYMLSLNERYSRAQLFKSRLALTQG